MKPYFYIYRPGTPGPTVKHPTLESAQAEAARLAAKHPGHSFEILRAIAITSTPVPEPTTFWMDGEHPPATATWAGDIYDKIADLGNGWSLILYPNGPAITDGDTIAVIDIHGGESQEFTAIKHRAQEAFRVWSWPRLLPKLTFPAPQNPVNPEIL